MFSLTVFLSAQLKNMSKDPEPKQVEEKKEKKEKPADAKKNDCCVCCNKALHRQHHSISMHYYHTLLDNK